MVLFVDASGDGADICGALTRTGEPPLGDNDGPSALDNSDLMWIGDSVRKKYHCWIYIFIIMAFNNTTSFML